MENIITGETLQIYQAKANRMFSISIGNKTGKFMGIQDVCKLSMEIFVLTKYLYR